MGGDTPSGERYSDIQKEFLPSKETKEEWTSFAAQLSTRGKVVKTA